MYMYGCSFTDNIWRYDKVHVVDPYLPHWILCRLVASKDTQIICEFVTLKVNFLVYFLRFVDLLHDSRTFSFTAIPLVPHHRLHSV